MGELLFLAFVFLVAGVIAVPIASRLGLGSVLGYLIAGIAISPLLAAFNVDVVSIQHFAEFGVVMMLFLVGLELEPKVLWERRAKLLGLGGLQVGATAALVAGIGMALGLSWSVAVAVGLVLCLSSTAIVLQTLSEKGLMKSDGGQSSFSVLLFQDIAVIPMLALIPLLALPELADTMASGAPADLHADPHAAMPTGESHGGDHGHDHGHGHGGGHDDHGGHGSMSLVDGLPAWAQALVTLGAIAAVILGGSLLTRPAFNFIAVARLREILVAAALLWVISVALLMTLVGLSPALGTFLAGVVLANSEYRHELESNIEPFKGLLLGLFFITVGASIDFALLAEGWDQTLLLTFGLMVLKAAVLFVLAVIFKVGGADRWLFTLGLAQAGEFGFVLLSLTVASSVVPQPLADQLLLVVALSMLLTPGLFILYDRVIAPMFTAEEVEEDGEAPHQGSIIIAGHGRFGGIINRMLRGLGYETVVVDYSSAQLNLIRTFGIRAYFGDATRPDLLEAAGIEHAKVLVVAIDGKEQITQLVHYVHKAYPHVHVVARAVDRPHVYELYAAGARDIIRETFDSGVRAARSTLEAMGVHPFQAERKARQFVDYDRQTIAALASVYDPDIPLHENKTYIELAKEIGLANDEMMRGKDTAFAARSDRGWNPPTLADVEAVTKNAEG
ncbi:MAG: cation:proton antiporter [Alphaproteobacteria bacterium]|nr:cation:proton antiporter [Alphaproteobacteria bacterium SS10]